MASNKTQRKALAVLNYDLFKPEIITPPAPATIDTKIRQHQERHIPTEIIDLLPQTDPVTGLPTVAELYRMFTRFNLLYFNGKLSFVRIEYSSRMTSAGSYCPSKRLIKISKQYHLLFPEEIGDTLKHEMIHQIYLSHNADFKREATRIGASVRARSHPSLRKPPKYLYGCPNCKKEYPRQKILRMASCGKCSKGGKFDKRYKLVLLKSYRKNQS